jgi:hypothetical protein
MDAQTKGVIIGAIGTAATLLTINYMFGKGNKEEKKNHGVATKPTVASKIDETG